MVSKIDAREKIINSAEEVFAHQGFGGARTADIAKKAGVNKALLHYYYSTKEGLYHAVMDRLLFDLVQIAQDILKKGFSGEKLVEGLFEAFFDYAAKHRHFVRLTTVESAGKESRYLENTLKNFFKPLFERAVDHLQSEARKGRLKKVDAPNFLITTYLAVLTYFSESKFIEAITGGETQSVKRLSERKRFLKQMIRSMLFK